VPKLNEIGIRGIFQPGTPMQEIVDFIAGNARLGVSSERLS
jgi:methylmalonyl-CoA mutase cobalamin-binding subunit